MWKNSYQVPMWLIKITKELNDKYGTNYSVEDIRKMNGLKDSDKIHENMRIVSPESFKEMNNENKARYFKNNEKGKENDEFYSRIITGSFSHSNPLVDLTIEGGTYTELKIRGDFEMRTTYLGFEAGVYNRELAPSFSHGRSMNVGLVKGSLEDLATYGSISGSINGNGLTTYYDKKSGELKGGKASIAPGTNVGIRYLPLTNIATNTATTTGPAQYKSVKLSEDYYYAPTLRKTKEYVFGEKKNGK
ncbi:hypothetical protein EHQ82_19850 [Leptospira selangorensis]|uniref:LysM domain-containing protein n=1 Tax=Leptospira selangorensis TaxID=2484982 RepID=A0ABY2MZK3_9LEPT|nr:hypothetical protein [Leptospira selangorensis]TGM12900.1 hypothetical protein EHQ82_19850 [Leptospira selangorensis]